jgi:tRNA nucleotidyltransferase (CCA-adding enzyme)
MAMHHFNLVEGGLYRTPLILEMKTPEEMAWDLGFQHAERGKGAEPNNPHVHEFKAAYMAGFNHRRQKKGDAEAPAGGRTDRPEQDIEPSLTLPVHDVPESTRTLASAIAKAGGRALVIGGAVRDKLMGKSPKDWDVEVYGLDTENLIQVLSTLGQVDAVGKQFGVLKIVIGDEDFDVSVPRREVKTGSGHRDYEIQPDPTMTIKEAARRRDFTMNTVAMDPHTGETFDPYGGVNDIKNRLLRATDPGVFVEDALRILRGAQFAARFGMTVDPNTMRLMQEASPELADLPVERVGTEWRKLLMKGEKPSLGMDVMKQTGALKILHPELDAMEDTPQDPDWHPEGNVWIHTKMVTDRATEITRDMDPAMQEVVRYAALMHDIAKPTMTTTHDDGHIRSRGHEEGGGVLIGQMFRQQFDVSKDLSEKVAKITTDHIKPQIFYLDRDKLTDGAIRRLARRLHPATIEELVNTSHADHTGRGEQGDHDFPAGDWLLQRAEELGVDKEPPKPLLMGRHLIQMGIKPGPHMGPILRKVYDMQTDGEVADLEGAMAAAKQLFGGGPDLQRESLNLVPPGR